ncbi:MAG TPA: 2OG-Fe(II) oxygenase [Vicinamibacterales bacterium]|nr:2OG-Fe(II) oxygenase [Vicinamibacterales bacterium]
MAAPYPDDRRFRSHVVMARHGFGRGEYKYFAHPLPDTVRALLAALYTRLAPLANRWNERMGLEVRYPAVHEGLSRSVPRCRAATPDAAAAALR